MGQDKSLQDSSFMTWAGSLAVSISGFAGLTLSAVYWSDVTPLHFLAFVLASAAVWSISLRLARGEVVNIDASIGLAAVLVLPVQAAVVASFIGSLVGVLIDRKSSCSVMCAFTVALTRPLPVAAAAGAVRLFGAPSPLDQQVAFVGVSLLAGAVYLIVDAASLAPGRRDREAGIVSILRPLGTLYLGHVSIGVVLGLLFPWMGLAGLLVLSLLVLLMQNSYSMYLRTRMAYQETIGVLALASELQSPSNAGHSQRVADLAAAAGKLLRLPSHTLETLNYAALLHDIGRIGAKDDQVLQDDEDHPRLGAEMVEDIPFLAPARKIIEYHHALDRIPLDAASAEVLATYLVGMCCQYDHFRSTGVGHRVAVNRLSPCVMNEQAQQVLSAVERAAREDVKCQYRQQEEVVVR